MIFISSKKFFQEKNEVNTDSKFILDIFSMFQTYAAKAVLTKNKIFTTAIFATFFTSQFRAVRVEGPYQVRIFYSHPTLQ